MRGGGGHYSNSLPFPSAEPFLQLPVEFHGKPGPKTLQNNQPRSKKARQGIRNSEKKNNTSLSRLGPIKGAVPISPKQRGGSRGVRSPSQHSRAQGFAGRGGSPKPALHMPRWSTREKKREESSHRRRFSPSSPCWDVTLRERLLVPLAQLIPALWEQHGTDRGRATVGSGNTVPPAQGHRNAGS